MDFGDILATWEQNPQHVRTVNKDADITEAGVPKDSKALRLSAAQSLKTMHPEASIDLHGLTREEAWTALDNFVSTCCSQDLRKILIVHGKGNHPGSDAVLYKMVREFIECDKRLGVSGHPDARLGGSGATWVAIKRSQGSVPVS
jgi:dsDNA-specific endonuclease/ATPase MutS2